MTTLLETDFNLLLPFKRNRIRPGPAQLYFVMVSIYLIVQLITLMSGFTQTTHYMTEGN